MSWELAEGSNGLYGMNLRFCVPAFAERYLLSSIYASAEIGMTIAISPIRVSSAEKR